jgi:hypothetical protein
MKTSAKQFSSAISKTVVALAITSVLGSICITPALADNDDHHDNDRHGRYEHHHHRDYDNDYYYTTPVYAPPPVYYAPPPVYYAPRERSGVSIVFPIDIR